MQKDKKIVPKQVSPFFAFNNSRIYNKSANHLSILKIKIKWTCQDLKDYRDLLIWLENQEPIDIYHIEWIKSQIQRILASLKAYNKFDHFFIA